MRVAPTRSPPRAAAPRKKPTRTGVKIAVIPGITISRSAARVLIQSAPSPDVGEEWSRAFDQGGFSALIRTYLDHRIAESGQRCTGDPTFAAHWFAVSASSTIAQPSRSSAETRSSPQTSFE